MRRCVCVSAEKVFASLPQVERGVSKIIGGDPKGNNFLYTNGKCVILRNIDVSIPFPPPGAGSVLCKRSSWLILPLPPFPSRTGGLGRRCHHAPSVKGPHFRNPEDCFKFIQNRFSSWGN